MILFTLILMIVLDIAIFLYIDYTKIRLIKYKLFGWFLLYIAISEEHLWEKLKGQGQQAEIIIPAAPIVIRLYRYFFPLKFTEVKVNYE